MSKLSVLLGIVLCFGSMAWAETCVEDFSDETLDCSFRVLTDLGGTHGSVDIADGIVTFNVRGGRHLCVLAVSRHVGRRC